MTGMSAMTGSLHDLAAQVGGYACVERRLFELLGMWSRQPSGPGVQMRFATAAVGHRRRAEAWRRRVPVVDGVDADHLCGTVPSALAEVLAELHELDTSHLDEDSFDRQRLDAAEAAAARLLSAYHAARAATDERVDAPTAVLLDRAIADLTR